MGPPLRILTGEAYGRKHLIRHRLSAVPPCPTPFVPSGHFPLTGGIGLKGKAGWAHAVRPYKTAGRSPPHPALRATFPPGGRSGRAATWGRPYENHRPSLPVGADVLIGPPAARPGCTPYKVCVFVGAVSLPAPPGGHMGPPLRILTGEAYGRKHLIRHRLSAVPPCPTPFCPFGTFPPDRGNRPKGEGWTGARCAPLRKRPVDGTISNS